MPERRPDPYPSDPTDTPLYLLQRHIGRLRERDGGQEVWQTERIYFTHAEASSEAVYLNGRRRKKKDLGWRVYSVSCGGDLRKLVAEHTDYTDGHVPSFMRSMDRGEVQDDK